MHSHGIAALAHLLNLFDGSTITSLVLDFSSLVFGVQLFNVLCLQRLGAPSTTHFLLLCLLHCHCCLYFSLLFLQNRFGKVSDVKGTSRVACQWGFTTNLLLAQLFGCEALLVNYNVAGDRVG